MAYKSATPKSGHRHVPAIGSRLFIGHVSSATDLLKVLGGYPLLLLPLVLLPLALVIVTFLGLPQGVHILDGDNLPASSALGAPDPRSAPATQEAAKAAAVSAAEAEAAGPASAPMPAAGPTAAVHSGDDRNATSAGAPAPAPSDPSSNAGDKADSTEPTPWLSQMKVTFPQRPLLDSMKLPVWTKPAPGTPVPPAEDFALRPEMVHFRAENNIIISAIANYGVKDLAYNFVHHLTALGLNNLLIATLDMELTEDMFKDGIPGAIFHETVSSGQATWGDALFKKIGLQRMIFIRKMLEIGVELLMCDTDVVWMRNPLPFMARYPRADILVSGDNLIRGRDDEGLEMMKGGAFQRHLNIGIVHLRPTKSTLKFLLAWMQAQEVLPGYWDQQLFNDVMRRFMDATNQEADDGLVHAMDGNLMMGLLPVALFCNGITFWILRNPEIIGIPPYSAHTNYVAKPVSKRHRFRESKLFYDPPEWYNPENGLLAFTNNIPENLLLQANGTEDTTNRSIELTDYQLRHIKKAFAVATILNRTLVIPAVHSYYHGLTENWRQFWWHDAAILKEPYVSPVDSLLAVWELVHMYDVDRPELSPPVQWREYSLLENPRMDPKVLSSTVKVLMCDGLGCEDTVVKHDASMALDTLHIEQHPKQRKLEGLIKILQPYRVVKIDDLQRAFGGWDDEELGKRFDTRVQRFFEAGRRTE